MVEVQGLKIEHSRESCHELAAGEQRGAEVLVHVKLKANCSEEGTVAVFPGEAREEVLRTHFEVPWDCEFAYLVLTE
jgi:hypothetical protein